MPDPRRTPNRGSRPGGRPGPGRGTARVPRPAGPAAARPAAPRRRPRLTARAGVLVLVLAVLAVSWASSMRAYVQQRSQISALKDQIALRQAEISGMEQEKQRWQDPAYVEQQARERFNFVMPGETSYVVLGKDGKPLDSQTRLTNPATVAPKVPTAWWTKAWQSVELAGNPPKTANAPATEIGP